MSSDSKKELIGRLISAYRANTSQEGAFDALAAARLGISPSDLRCLDLVQASGGMTAGELAIASGLTTGAVTAVIDRLERRFTAQELRTITEFLETATELGERHAERIAPR